MLKFVSDIQIGDILVSNSDYGIFETEVTDVNFLDMDGDRMKIIFADAPAITVNSEAIVQVSE